MPLILTPFVEGTLCQGSSWTVSDISKLAEHVGKIALGQSHHVAKILAGTNIIPPPTSEAIRKGAIKLLTVPKGEDPWHRDGWIFQAISWLAASRASPSAATRAPHMILAHKGFDGLQLEIDASTGAVVAAVIFEDKATIKPRETIRKEVWEDFKLLEDGDRENVLSADVSSLLLTRPEIDADKAIEAIIWKQVRHYRVSITIGKTHAAPDGRKRLFDGYDKIAAGDIQRRRAEVLHIADLRPWMSSFASTAIASINATAPAHV